MHMQKLNYIRENKMTKDEIQKAYDALYRIQVSAEKGIGYYSDYEIVKDVLYSAQVKAETVDLEKLREEMAVKLSALIPHSYSDAVFYNLFDCITGEFNITRRTK